MAAAWRGGRQAVESGIAIEYRHIDTAAKYENEDAVGRGIRMSGIPRSELFITTKLRGSDMAAGHTRAGLERSLTALAIDYVDLYLIHWPLPWLGQFSRAFLDMASLADEGLIRSIGVSNFQAHHVARLGHETGLTPAVDQVECDPKIQRRSLRADLAARGTVTQAWSPLGRGGPLLSDPVVLRTAEAASCAAWSSSPSLAPGERDRAHREVRGPRPSTGEPRCHRHATVASGILAEIDGLDPHDEGERGIRDSDTYEEL